MLNPKELLSYTKDLSVLFVEDHEDIRENTSEILRNFFNTVDSVENGEVALRQYKTYFDNNSKHYDIILSDIHMPRINGVSLVEYIYGINNKQKVLILSAYDDSKYLLPLINLGIEQFILKPIDYQDLLQALLNVSKNIKLLNTDTPQQTSSKLINFDSSFTFNKENDLLMNNDSIISLTKYEIIFLQLLTDNVGKIYSNEVITSHYTSLDENLDIANIRKLVSKLRKKLPKTCIECIYGIGYRVIPYIDI